MGKLVLYWAAALILGNLMVVIPMGIGLTGYVLMTEPGEVSAEAFVNAIFTGFVLYLAAVWATQESFAEQYRLFPRVMAFIVSPILVMYFHAEWSLLACLLALAVIASFAAYQMLVTVATRRSREPT
jgi:hypothetical protein